MLGFYVDAFLVSWVVFLPGATAILLLAANGLTGALLRSNGLPKVVWQVVAAGSAGLTFFAAAFGLWGRFDPEQTGYQLMEWVPWLPEYGIHYFVGIDGISLVLVLLTTFLVPVVLLATWNDGLSRLRAHLFFVLVLESLLLGTFVSLNLFQFYLLWELSLIPMLFLIGIWGGPGRIPAATKFALVSIAGSVLMLVAMVVLYRINFEQAGVQGLDLVRFTGRGGPAGLPLLETRIAAEAGSGVPWWQTQPWLFAAFALAFGVRIPVLPFHTWLPDAQVEAPTGAAVLLGGALVKLGGYGLLRFVLPLFPDAVAQATPLLFAVALAGILYGSCVALVQSDLRRLVAYASVAQLGFVVLGVFSLNLQGLTGAVLQMVVHGLATAALLLLFGFVHSRRRSRQIGDLGGLARPMPVFAALLGFAVMTTIGVPALGGFVAEFLVLLGAFGASVPVGFLAAFGFALSAAVWLWMYRRVVFGPLDKPENRGLIDLDLRERIVVVALVIPIVWIGVYPSPFLRRVEPSVSILLQDMELRRLQELEQRRLEEEGEVPLALAPRGDLR